MIHFFLFVQLASFGSNESSNAGNKWAELREAQTKTLSLPKTGMAVTTDIGEPKDIHPKNKQEVGRRLAAIALNILLSYPTDMQRTSIPIRVIFKRERDTDLHAPPGQD